MSFVDDRQIQRRSEFLRTAAAIVDPDLDEFRFYADVVPHRFTRFFDRGDRIRHVGSGGMTIRSRSRPCESRTCSVKEGRAQWHFIADTERDVSPIRSAAVQ